MVCFHKIFTNIQGTISRRGSKIVLQKWVKLNVGRWKRHTTEGKTIEALKSSHTPSPCNPDTTQIATTTHTADPVEDLKIWGAIVILIT